jgi:hypothetical protein
MPYSVGQKFMLGPQQGDIRFLTESGNYYLVIQPTDSVPGHFVELDPGTFQRYIDVELITIES